MASGTDEITVIPQIMLLEQVLDEVRSGRLRVPKFQRPFVWRPEQMLSLFDSIERGYPIGSLLVWDTSLAIPSLGQVGSIPVPDPTRGSDTGFLVDGHQRISTLFGSLLQHRDERDSQSQRNWMWRIYRVLGEPRDISDRFRHWRRPESPPANYLPMRAVLRTMDFLAYSRELAKKVPEDRLSILVDEAEELAHRIKSYQVAVVRLKSGDLRHTVEVFARLNSSGQSMTPDQMVSALTFQPGGDSLADRIDAIREELGGTGFGQIPSITIFRSILAVAGEQDVMSARWEVLAQRLKGSLALATDDAERALARAVIFLREQIGVPLARLVPYQHQVMLLTAFFHRNPEPTDGQLYAIIRWFWGTSWSGFFAGANTTQVKDALARMKNFAAHRDKSPWTAQTARPFPDKFDLRSARVRAFILWELRKFSERDLPGGRRFDPVIELARSDTEAYKHVAWNIPSVSHPANRLIMPTSPGISVRRALLDMSAHEEQLVLASHGIPQRALERLRQGDAEGFVTERAEELAFRERAFMSEMEITPSAESQGDADIDTE